MLRLVSGRWWRGGVPLAVALAGMPAVAAAPPVLRELRLVAAGGGQAVVLRASEPIEAVVVPVQTAGGIVRLHVDLPRGTRLAPGVPRVIQGAPPLLRAR